MSGCLRLGLLFSPLLLACGSTAPLLAADVADGGSCSAASASSAPCNGGQCTVLPPTCPTSCTPLGAVRFRLLAPSTYTAGEYSWAMDAGIWFSVTTASGEALQVVPPTSDEGPSLYWAPSCSECVSLQLAAGSVMTQIPAGGITATWNGAAYSLTSTCNESQFGEVPCGDVLCAAAGKYVVKMCASPPGATTSQCVSVPFDFPGTPEVDGALGQ